MEKVVVVAIVTLEVPDKPTPPTSGLILTPVALLVDQAKTVLPPPCCKVEGVAEKLSHLGTGVTGSSFTVILVLQLTD